MEVSPTSDEKIMAALAHGSIFLMFLGPVVPAVIWASQRKKSKYVSFHALQAMGYQALVFWLWIVVMILIPVLIMCLAFPLAIAMTKDSHHAVLTPFALQIFIFLFIFGFMGLSFLTGIIGAVLCLLGREFRYPLIGKWLERHLPYQADSETPIDEVREDNWVAGICHATAILQLWGVITPLIVWFTQKERSARLRFQSMQAAVYQGIALVIYFAGMGLYMVAVFGMVFIPMALWSVNRGNGGEPPAPAGIAMLAFLVIIIIVGLIFFLLMPVYYLLAAIASLRVIQGHPFHYPILGGILEKRMGISQNQKPEPAT